MLVYWAVQRLMWYPRTGTGELQKTHFNPIPRNVVTRKGKAPIKKRERTEVCFKDGEIDINQPDVRRSTT
jgi:hypothetical protein